MIVFIHVLLKALIKIIPSIKNMGKKIKTPDRDVKFSNFAPLIPQLKAFYY